MIILQILLLLLLIVLPGMACWFAWGYSLKTQLRGLEWLFLVIVTGLAWVSWVSLLLAEFERFSLPLLAIILLIGSGVIVGWAVRNGRSYHHITPFTWEKPSIGTMLLLGLAITLSPQPFEYIVGGRDHGVYVNTGVHIVRSGGILVYDETITAVPATSRDVLIKPETRLLQAGFPGPWSEGVRLTGLTIRDADEGIYLPHAFHLYPALIAVFYAVGGIQMALSTTMVLGLLGGLSIYLVIRRLFGWQVGLIAYFLLNISVTQVWFTQYPSAEIMVQLFFWSGLLAALLMLETKNRTMAVLAGICFGLLHLTKLDTVIVPVSLLFFFLYQWIRRQFHPSYWWAVVPYSILSIHAVLHAFFIATIYFIDHAVRNLLPTFVLDAIINAASGYPYPLDILNRLLSENGWSILLALLALAGAIWLLRTLQRPLDRIITRVMQRQKWIQNGTAVLLGGFAMSTAVASTTSITFSFLSNSLWSAGLTRLYMTRVGILVGVVGLVYLIFHSNRQEIHFALLLLIGNVLPLFILGAGTAPDHFWVIRRFITITFPLFIMSAAYLIWACRPRHQRWWPMTAIPVGLFVLIALGFWQHTKPLLGAVDYDGLSEQLRQVAAATPDNAVLLFSSGTHADQLNLPLWLIFGKTVYAIQPEVMNDPRLETAVSHWISQDRPVYWVSSPTQTMPTWDGWQFNFSHTQIISTPLVETPRDHIPNVVRRYEVQLDTYQLLLDTAVISSTQPESMHHRLNE